MPSLASPGYGVTTWLEKLHMVFILAPLPLVILGRVLISPFSSTDRHKSWGRVITDISFRYSSSSLKVNQIQGMMGTDEDVYMKWCKKARVTPCIEELEDGGKGGALMWLSEKENSMEKVVLYLHGGCYCLPIQDFAADYWKKLVDSVNRDTSAKSSVGLVALKYSLIPAASFPTPLAQTVAAIQHLITSGISPENIHIAGESAGGGLVLQLLSHLLHPYPSVPPLTLAKSSKLGSMCIMSPIASLTSTSKSYTANSDLDVLPSWSWSELCAHSHGPLKKEPGSRPYLEPANAPEGWWKGAQDVVGKVWVSVGEWECLRDDVLTVATALKTVEGSDEWLTSFVEPKGVHNSQYLDCMVGESGELARRIQEWEAAVLAN
ncbi:Alpha/Beta hydrolase protein [Coprinopsis sp. MPI-PUGE-AT-0042]|nr:Alpha/Beta hydrolase protein [Coprinopsis sp. MPI-PUGE-AT-0042]